MQLISRDPLIDCPDNPWDYHLWFAWYPVKTWNCDWTWLHFIYRRIGRSGQYTFIR